MQRFLTCGLQPGIGSQEPSRWVAKKTLVGVLFVKGFILSRCQLESPVILGLWCTNDIKVGKCYINKHILCWTDWIKTDQVVIRWTILRSTHNHCDSLLCEFWSFVGSFAYTNHVRRIVFLQFLFNDRKTTLNKLSTQDTTHDNNDKIANLLSSYS